MKKVFMLLLAVGFFSCGNRLLQNAERDYRPGFLQDTMEGIELRVVPARYTVPPERVRLQIANRSDHTIQFGAGYRIEWWDEAEDRWVEFGPPEGTAVIAIMYVLEPGRTEGYDIALFPERIGYNIPGTYRITKQIYTGEETRDFSGSFLLDAVE